MLFETKTSINTSPCFIKPADLFNRESLMRWKSGGGGHSSIITEKPVNKTSKPVSTNPNEFFNHISKYAECDWRKVDNQTLEVAVNPRFKGAWIGKRGATIRAFQKHLNTRIKLVDGVEVSIYDYSVDTLFKFDRKKQTGLIAHWKQKHTKKGVKTSESKTWYGVYVISSRFEKTAYVKSSQNKEELKPVDGQRLALITDDKQKADECVKMNTFSRF